MGGTKFLNDFIPLPTITSILYIILYKEDNIYNIRRGWSEKMGKWLKWSLWP